jgi:hypothetical protein
MQVAEALAQQEEYGTLYGSIDLCVGIYGYEAGVSLPR